MTAQGRGWPLEARAERAGQAVRLRRAAILEQRLGRLEDAIAELQAIVQEAPESGSALRYLADLR